MQRPDQRVGIFVDVSNIYHSAKQCHSARVNFAYIMEKAVAGRKLIVAKAYAIRSPIDQDLFFDALTRSGYQVCLKDLQVFHTGIKKGDWDVGISIDIVKVAEKLDAVILVTGDGDFVPLGQYVKERGCKFEVMAVSGATSAKLKEIADHFTDISSDEGFFLRRPEIYNFNANNTVAV